ncbi:MAG: hypothetical protein KIT14_06195 [bacterium]|nr:hypothetical protein [bacterium]
MNPLADVAETVRFVPVGDCVLCAPLPPGTTTSGGVSRSPAGDAGRSTAGGSGALPSSSGHVGD